MMILSCAWFRHQESWTFIARDREERDLWTNSLVHAIHEAAAFGQDDMDFGEDLATWVSDVAETCLLFRQFLAGICHSVALPRL